MVHSGNEQPRGSLQHAGIKIITLVLVTLILCFPALSFAGTLSVYAEAGDGQVSNSGSVYSTVQGSSSGDSANYLSQGMSVGQNFDGSSYTDQRSFLAFDTSSIPVSASIDSATLYIYKNFTFTSGRDFPIIVTSATNSSTSQLITSDYNKVSVLSGGSVWANSLTSGAYTAISLSITGIEFINKGGMTKLSLRSLYDINISAPTGPEWASVYTRNASDSARWPKLIVNYTPSPTHDLRVDSVEIHDYYSHVSYAAPPVGASVYFVANAYSQSGGTPSFRVTCVRDGVTMYNQTMSRPTAGAFFPDTQGWGPWVVTSGSHSYTWTLDVDGDVAETNESNNFGSGNWTTGTPSITVTYPNGGETLEADTAYNITWAVANYGGNVYIRLYKGGLLQETIYSSVLGTLGSASWTPSGSLPIGSDYRIRIGPVGDTFAYDESNSNFTVNTTAPLSLVSPPNGGTESETVVNFQWTGSGTKYELLVDNNSGFGSPELYLQNHLTTSYAFDRVLPENLYYWKVRKFDGSSWSESDIWTFTYSPTLSEKPVLLPLYRTYKSESGKRDHYYILDPAKRDTAINVSGYTDEGIEGYISDRAFAGSKALMMLYLDSEWSHYYTTDEGDKDNKIIQGYEYQGVVGYVFDQPSVGLVQLHHLHQTTDTPYHYFMCIDKDEYEVVMSGSFGTYEELPVLGYVSPYGMADAYEQTKFQSRFAGVDTGTGAFRQFISPTGLTLAGRGPQLFFRHSYNSLDSFSLPLSKGWSHSLFMFAMETPNEDVIVRWGDGSESVFTKNGSLLDPVPGNYYTITKVDDGVNYGYEITAKDQTIFGFRRLSSSPPPDQIFVPSMVPVWILDRHGNQMNLSHDAATALLQTATDATGREFTFGYDSESRLISVTDSSISRSISFSYDPTTGLLNKYTNARFLDTTYQYDSNGRLSTATYPHGNTVAVGYDLVGRATSVQKSGEPSTALAYPPANARQITDPRNEVWTHTYTGGLLTQIDDPDPTSNPLLLEYNDANNPFKPTRVVDRRNNEWNYEYDSNGNVTKITDPLGAFAEMLYDANNNLLWRREFRTTGGPIEQTTFTYDGTNARLIDVDDSLGNNTHFDYNGFGEITSVRNGNLHATQFTYDSNGNLDTLTDPLNNLTDYDHDPGGRPTKITDAELKSTSFTYDLNDNMESVTDDVGNVTYMFYDDNDNMTNTAFFMAGEWNYYGFYRDQHDRLETVLDPGSTQVALFSYDASGDMWSRFDNNFDQTTYVRDERDLITRINYQSTGAFVDFTHDENGNLKTMDESWIPGSHTFDYDDLNRLSLHTDTYGQMVQYGYDPAGRLNQIIYPGPGKVLTYDYDAAGRMTAVFDWTGGQTSYVNDEASNLIGQTDSNGTSSVLSYDLAERLTRITHKKSNDSVFADYALVLDKVGNPLTINNIDPIDPIVPYANITYTLVKGNRLSGETGGVTYTSDFNGNRTNKNSGSVNTDYVYDQENRLTDIDVTPGGSVDYVYDGLGNRIAKIENGVTTRYVLDLSGRMSNVLMETDGAGTPKSYYVHGQGLAAKIAPAGARYAYHGDQVGSVVAMTDASENVVNRYAYGPYGEILAEDEAISDNPFQYVGIFGVMQEPNNLLYMRARYYDPLAGRFLSPDPIGFEGGDWNLFAYAAGRPYLLFDPSGKELITTAVVTYAIASNVRFFFERGADSFLSLQTYRYYQEQREWARTKRAEFSGNINSVRALNRFLNETVAAQTEVQKGWGTRNLTESVKKLILMNVTPAGEAIRIGEDVRDLLNLALPFDLSNESGVSATMMLHWPGH